MYSIILMIITLH